jgi:hypothetical protein
MKVEIDDDCVDKIVQEAIIWNYVNLTDEIKNSKGVHPEDLENYKRVSEALKVLGDWFFVVGEFDKQVKKARKKK